MHVKLTSVERFFLSLEPIWVKIFGLVAFVLEKFGHNSLSRWPNFGSLSNIRNCVTDLMG